MKNQIIKKIMAYLLVGAMVITTPMTASANELENAYSTGTEDGKNIGTGSGSGTSTSTNTATQSVDLPEEISKQLPHIIGIALDKTSLEFAEIGDTAYVQARALFDDYDAADEEMQWITNAEKQKIEANIHWYSDDFSVASIGSVKNANGTDVKDENDENVKGKVGPKAEIKAVGEGTTTIYAWIEADGQQYVNAPQRPTPGDFIATATVTVRGQSVTGITFDKTQVPWVVKRQYDLTKYTKIVFGEGENIKEKTVEQYSGSVVYGLLDPTPASGQSKAKAKATLTDAGILKITAGQAGEKINFTITTESGYSKVESVTLIEPVPVSKIDVMPNKDAAKFTLDMGSTDGYNADKKRVEKSVEVQLYRKENRQDVKASVSDVTDELVWTSNKPAIANVEGDGDKAVIYTTGAVGTAKITVKATSGKSAAFTVTVTATPAKVIPGNATTYTGKKITVPVKLEGENGLNLPVDKKTKLRYVIEDSYAKSNYASVNGKGIISPKDVLYVKGDNGRPDKTGVEPSVEVDVKVTAKYGTADLTVEPAKAKITIRQSNVQDLTIDTEQFKENKWNKMDGYTLTNNVSKITLDSKGNKPLYVGNTYRFAPTAGAGSSEGALESVTWTPSKKGIVLTSDDGVNYKAEITDSTKSTVKAAYIKLEKSTNNNTYKARKVTKTITISPVQMAKALIIDKPVQVVQVDKTLHNVKKATTVTVKVKALDPKKSTDKIQWKVLSDIKDADGNELKITAATAVRNGYAYVNGDLQDKDGNPVTDKDVTDDAKNKSIKITIPKDAVTGSVVKVGAYAQGGAVAYAYIYVTEPTKSIVITESTVGTPATATKKSNGLWSKNSWDLELGKKATITPMLTIDGNAENSAAGLSAWTQGDTTAYTTEYLTYTLDKKSAQIIRVDKNGTITPIKKGKATVTIKTASGKKSAKITINVNAPTTTQS